MRRTAKLKKVKAFTDLKQALQDALEYEQGRKPALRVSELPPAPKPLTPRQIRAIRQQFNVSQAAFARIINVSTNTVESWEQGARRPRDASLKLLTIAQVHPEVFWPQTG
jgi:DNA-binding transcriptional regulator YiaG